MQNDSSNLILLQLMAKIGAASDVLEHLLQEYVLVQQSGNQPEREQNQEQEQIKQKCKVVLCKFSSVHQKIEHTAAIQFNSAHDMTNNRSTGP